MASKRRLRRRACTSKVTYNSVQEANNAKFANVRRGEKSFLRVHPYKCTFCSKFHLGRTPHRIKIAIKKSMVDL